MAMADSGETTQIKARSSPETKRRIKAIAAMEGKSMTELLNEMMEEKIEESDFDV